MPGARARPARRIAGRLPGPAAAAAAATAAAATAAASPSASHSFPLALLAAASVLYRLASDGALALAALRAEAGWGYSAGLVGLTYGVVMPLAEAGAMVAVPRCSAQAAARWRRRRRRRRSVAAAAVAGPESGEEAAAARAAMANGPPAVDPRLDVSERRRRCGTYRTRTAATQLENGSWTGSSRVSSGLSQHHR